MAGEIVSVCKREIYRWIRQLITPTGDEFKEVRKEVSFLKDEISDINPVLRKPKVELGLNSNVKIWMDQIKGLSLDLQDCIDDAIRLDSVGLRPRGTTLWKFEAFKKLRFGEPSYMLSLSLFGEPSYMPSPSMFKYLQVLVIEFSRRRSYNTVDLTSASQLFLLRNVKVNGYNIKLPTEIRGLVHLETLELVECNEIVGENLPSDIIHLPRLSHLTVTHGTMLPQGFEKMKSLRTLSGFHLGKDSLKEIMGLGKLTNLRDLSLSIYPGFDLTITDSEALISSIGMIHDLRCLYLKDGSVEDEDDQLASMFKPPLLIEVLEMQYWEFSGVPKSIGYLHHLRIMKLRVREMCTEGFHILGELPSLVDLSLWVAHVFAGRTITVGTGLFPLLENFQFRSHEDVTGFMEFQAEAMPKVQKLHLEIVESWGGAIPVGMECLLGLQQIHLRVRGSVRRDVKSVFRRATQVHPGRPSITIKWPRGSIIPAYSEKEMLAIEPHFPFGLNKEVACSLEESKDNFLGKSLSVSGAGEVNNPDASDEPQLNGAHAGPEGNISETAASSLLVVTRAVDAPMSSSLGAMGPLLRKLGLLLSDDYPLTKPRKEGLELLKDDLEEISAALLELSATDSRNQMVKFWMDEARELSFDIDDFADDMLRTHSNTYAKITPVRPHRVGRLKTTLLRKNLKSSTRTTKMAELWNLVQEASERHDRYVDGVTVASTTPCHAFTGHGRASGLSGVASNHLVGNDDLKMKLIKWLTDKAEKQLKVVPVVGPAGVGKTTLAKQVYREVGGQFECWAFVRVSRKPDMRRLLGGILSQVQRHRRASGTSCCTVQVLIDNVTKHLRDKRYIIVIDDMWETTAWDIVKRAFPDSNNGSRIMTTTETEGVALECCGYQSNSNILEMEPLGSQECGKLFFNMVFGPGHPCPEQFKKISDRIIEKCAGLPLATICVAGLLASRPENSELWHHVQEYLCSNLSTCSTLEEGLQQILRLSYYSLPQYLKTCLMYFNIYLEGYTMWKADLVTQWIAEGFVYATEGKDTEEVAGSYFDELVSRGMILPVEINYNDEVLSCTLHHSVLDLIAHESNEEKFITALDYSQTITGFHGKARRLSLHFSNSRYATKPAGLTPSQARSLAFFGILRCMPSIVGFKLLRVLVLEFCDIIGCESLNLAGICRLFQLRYLKISCDVRVELPAQMQRLQYLETLDIHAIVSAVPLDIIHLPGLLHLSLGDKANLPEGIGRVRSLRTLHYFDLGRSSEYNVLSLGELMNLQDLHLTYHTDSSDEHLKKNLVALACSLGKLVNLKSVSLAPGAFGTAVCHDVWSHMSSPPAFLQRLELSPPICIFSRLPHWIGGLHKLRILTVVVTELLMKDVDMLTGLPDLKVLSLYVRQPTAESIVFRRGAFPALKYFKYTCGVLRLAFQEEALPKLQRLELGFNAHRGEEYDHLLTGIEHLSSLKEIGGIIGAVPGAEEQDRCTAESALEVAIQKHQRFSSYVIVKGADWVEEEHGPQEKQHLIEAEARNVMVGGRSVVPIVVECALLWGLTSVSGRRRKMEDAAVAVPRLTSLPLCVRDSGEYHPMLLRLRMHFCGVYNGHGGAEVARYCRDRLHTALVEELSKIEPVSVASLGPAELQNQWEKVFVDCFCRVDDEVLGKASRGGGQGGSSTSDVATAAAMVQPVAPDHVSSTAVVAVICSSHIIVANCGDSRAVLCRGKLWAQPLSLDHTPSREDERARIEAGGGKTLSCNGYQVLGLLPMSRSIGDRYLKPWIIPVPEVTVVPRGKDDECLILASDGLWDVMSNEEACNAARKSILLWYKRNGQKSSSSLVRRRGSDSADPAAQAAAARLVELALRKGSKDDITVIVVDLKALRKFNKRT